MNRVAEAERSLLRHLKPSFAEGTEVYAPRWPGSGRSERRTKAANTLEWLPGKVESTREVEPSAGSPYGPIRFYDIRYDGDGDGEIEYGIEDFYVFSKADYHLSTKNDGRSSSWIGVKNVTDCEIEGDKYPRIVGWYVASIDGQERPFALLSDAMDAYDNHIVRRHDKKIMKSDLNRPEKWSRLFEKSESPKKVSEASMMSSPRRQRCCEKRKNPHGTDEYRDFTATKRTREVKSIADEGKATCDRKGCRNRAQKGGICKKHGAVVIRKNCIKHAQKGKICMKHGAIPISKKCSHDGCTNFAVKGGICVKHGAVVIRKKCSHDGCTNNAIKGGVCVKHGATYTRKKCSHDGCTNNALNRGVCSKHGATYIRRKCSHDGCTRFSQNGGVCIKHGAISIRRKCSHDGCTNNAQKGGVCKKHGAVCIHKKCSHDGCTNYAQKGGVCVKHGAIFVHKKKVVMMGAQTMHRKKKSA